MLALATAARVATEELRAAQTLELPAERVLIRHRLEPVPFRKAAMLEVAVPGTTVVAVQPPEGAEAAEAAADPTVRERRAAPEALASLVATERMVRMVPTAQPIRALVAVAVAVAAMEQVPQGAQVDSAELAAPA